MNTDKEIARYIIVKGLVQGIGFRPFIYKIASELAVVGWVENRSDSVWIFAQATSKILDSFVSSIQDDAPPLCKIESLEIREAVAEAYATFSIRESRDSSTEVTRISPDIAVCDACLEDMQKQPHRINYPFVNCTLCGPRFSIIKDVPYDREKTTMHTFAMCDQCKKEYTDITDRRFHAQPVACNNCGPLYTMQAGTITVSNFSEIVETTSRLIIEGKSVAVKGIGGYHLACNALDQNAVDALRKRKRRDHKPFAVMFADVDVAKEYVHLIQEEIDQLLSPERPIVLCKLKKEIPEAINTGLDTLGVFLPYMPFHYALFEKTGLQALVFTSGNFSDDPIVIDNGHAQDSLSAIADAVVSHNRDIYNRVDDSVVTVMAGTSRILRRSRGYVPTPIQLTHNCEGIFAAGAELKNCFALGVGTTAQVSQHIGDLKTVDTYSFYTETIKRFSKLFRTTPSHVVCDLHPDYLSTQYSRELSLPIIEVQHHHAHIASCMAEHGLDEPVIGISLDGTGYGEDGAVWGGEFLIADLQSFKRFSHLAYVGMPGGDRAALEPWRMALSYLYACYGNAALDQLVDLFKVVPKDHLEMALLSLEKDINAPKTSSMGRFFDAVAALLGLCHYHRFEAEGAMRLEIIAGQTVDESYAFECGAEIKTEKVIAGIIQDLNKKVPTEIIAAKFHNTIVRIILAVSEAIRSKEHIDRVVLSGGTFQNRYIFTRTLKTLRESGFSVYTHSRVPCNDGGIALGQLAIAAKRRMVGCV